MTGVTVGGMTVGAGPRDGIGEREREFGEFLRAGVLDSHFRGNDGGSVFGGKTGEPFVISGSHHQPNRRQAQGEGDDKRRSGKLKVPGGVEGRRSC